MCVMLSVVLLLSLSGAAAADQARVFIEDVSASAGDTVTVSVCAERVSACGGGSFNVVYDGDALELVSCAKGAAMEGVSPFINAAYAENTLRMTWMTSGTIRDGSLLDMVFRLKDGAERSLPVRLEALKLSDADGSPIPATVTDGWIVLGGGSLVVTDLSLLDYRGNRAETLGAGSNKVRAEIHNTLDIPVEPVVVCALYRDGKLVSSAAKSAEQTLGRNETLTVEQIVNVPAAQNVSLTVTVWDGVLNLAPVYSASLAGE